MIKKILFISSLTILLAGCTWFGAGKDQEPIKLPPELIIISADYNTSTSEAIIKWQANNVANPTFHSGVRYDTESHKDIEPISNTYPFLMFPKIDEFDALSAIIPIKKDITKIFFRVQLEVDNEFFWTEERELEVTE